MNACVINGKQCITKTIKKKFLETRQPHSCYLGREKQTEVLLRKNTPTSREAGAGAAGGAGARGGAMSPRWGPQQVRRVWPAWERGTGDGKDSPPGLCTKVPATATRFWSIFYNMTRAGIWGSEKANSSRNSLCSGSLPLEFPVPSYATQTGVSSGRTAGSSLGSPHDWNEALHIRNGLSICAG